MARLGASIGLIPRGIAGAPDVTAPTITSSASLSVTENSTLAHALTSSESVTWTIRTSAQNVASVDYDEFEISGSTLRWVSNGTRDYETPTDTGANNTYVVVVRATDGSNNTTDQAITVTVTDIAEVATFYVSPTGSDSNDGLTTGTAWQTLTKVNAATLAPGTTVLFQGGQTFSGTLDLTAVLGDVGDPIAFGSYGTGRATINAANSIAVYGDDSGGNYGYITIDGIDLVGNGKATNTTHGLMFWNDDPGAVKRSGITLRNMEVSGFGQAGLLFGADPSDNGATGFADLLVEDCVVHDCGGTGIQVYGAALHAHTDPIIRRCTVYDCDLGGIIVSHADDGVAEDNIVHDCGAAYTGGSVGMMMYQCDSTVFRGCEVYNQETPNEGGGNGINIDFACTNCIVEYCYTHDNTGAGLEAYGGSGTWADNTFRYCVSENNGANNQFMGAFNYATGSGAMTGLRCYNNTFHMGIAGRGVVRIANNNLQGDFINNIFYADNGADLIKAQTDVEGSLTPHAGLLFRGNAYHSTSSFSILWGGSSYSTMAAWRAAYATQETISAADVSIVDNPDLVAPGAGGIINAVPASLTAYELVTGSPMIGVGLNVTTLLGVDEGNLDFYGTTVPHGVGTGFNVGAYGDDTGVAGGGSTAGQPLGLLLALTKAS
jgi:hypothetical protein